MLDFWQTVATQLQLLVNHRDRLSDASLGGVPLEEVSPAILAQVFIDTLAPFVREIHRRSPDRNELVLKRKIKDGRREEQFISVRELTAHISTLSPERRPLFAAFGLDEEPMGQDVRHGNERPPDGWSDDDPRLP